MPPPSVLLTPHWVAYRLQAGRNGKTDKLPISPHMGTMASSTAPDTWGTYQIAIDRAEADGLAGAGYVLTKSARVVGVDLDHCVQPDGNIEDRALQIVHQLNSYTEFSPSGTGLHIWCRGTLPPGRRKNSKIEMYDDAHFLTWTGNQLAGTPDGLQERTAELAALHAEMFAPEPTATQPAAERIAQPQANTTAPDQIIIDRIVNASNTTDVSQLYAGDWQGRYPSQSEADLSLCSHLAFYCGGNVDQIDRLFRGSGLYRRKWDIGNPTYGERTIQRAITTLHNTYTGASGNGHGATVTNTVSTGWQFYTLEDAYQPRAPAVHVVDGLFELPSLNIVYGPPGCLKSFLLADMCCCIAGGVPWLDHLPNMHKPAARAVMPSPCVWVDLDNGARRSHERFEAIGRTYGLPTNTPLHYVSMPNPWLDASAAAVFAMMTREFTNLGARLIVVDNLGATLGKLDENSAEMALVMSAFRKLAEDTNAAVILVHHQRKSYGGGKTRQGDSLRGHSSIEAALDLALLVEREPQSDDITVRATKCRGADVLPFAARFTYQNRGNSKELEAVRFWGIEAEPDPNSPVAIQQAIMDALTTNGTSNQRDLWQEVKSVIGDDAPGRNRIIEVITQMVSAGLVQEGTGQHNSKVYWL